MTTFTGVKVESIGSSYDVALGYGDPNQLDNTGSPIVHMVGYTLALGSPWSESTDIQDETHIVQISTLSTDRFARYPQQSQGDWSGGERQLFAPGSSAFSVINFNEYWTTDGKINPTVPGALQLLPGFQTGTLNGGTGGLCPLGTDGLSFYMGFNNGSTNLYITQSPSGSGTNYVIGDGSQIVSIISGYDSPNRIADAGVIVGLQTGGIKFVNQAGTVIGTYTADGVSTRTQQTMCLGTGGSVAPSIFYIKAGDDQVWYTRADTFSGAQTALSAIPAEYGIATNIFSIPSDIIYVTQTQNVQPGVALKSYVWSTKNGSVSGELIGEIVGGVIGGGAYNGDLFLVASPTGTFSQLSQPTGSISIYQIAGSASGSSLTIFDDYRDLDTVFQLKQGSFYPVGCSVVGDGRYMYVSVPGMAPRSYDLATTGNPVFQFGPDITTVKKNTNPLSHQLVEPNSGTISGPFETVYDDTGLLTMQQSTGNAKDTGVITLSWMDFGAVGVIKRFRQFTIELASVLPGDAKVTVQYQVDNGAIADLNVVLDPVSLNYTGIFPVGLKGYRIQMILKLWSSTSSPYHGPVIRYISLKATLGRAWKFSVSCVRNQRLRNQGSAPGEDPQGLRAQEKIANIINIYEVAAGNLTMMFPSPTMPNGIETVNCVLLDYDWKAGKEQPGPYNTEYGAFDMEGNVDLTIVENI